jgi:hypothetical protein
MENDRFFTIVCSSALALTVLIFVGVHLAPRWDLALWDDSPAPIEAEDSTAALDQAEPGLDPADLASTEAGLDYVEEAAVIQASHEIDSAPAADAEAKARFVRTIDAIAAGASPELSSASLPGMTDVLVRVDRDGRTVVAAGTMRRYQQAVDAITSLEPEAAVAAFRMLEGELDQTYQQLGDVDGSFEERLQEAVDHLLAVSLPRVEPDMISKDFRWAFADADKARLSASQKHLLLMGRSSALKVQARLEELRNAFGWPEPVAATETEVERETAERPVMIADASGSEGDSAGADSAATVAEPEVPPMIQASAVAEP